MGDLTLGIGIGILIRQLFVNFEKVPFGRQWRDSTNEETNTETKEETKEETNDEKNNEKV